jgi:hypothetical protein
MSDADRESTTDHAGEQPYTSISLLDHDETSIKIFGPTATDPTISKPCRLTNGFSRLARQRADA